MGDTFALIALNVLLAVLTLLVLAYWKWPGFRFWFSDIWADFPLIGTISRRLSRMSRPTTEEANRRLDELFRAYHLHIHEPISMANFDRYRQYLFLAGDSDSKPIPLLAWAFLFALLTAEAFTFSFLLGVSISPDISQNGANVVAVVLAFLTAVVLALLSHPAGHSIRRTKELKSALREAVDKKSLEPSEKPFNDLTERISLEADQDRDKPKQNNFDSQRLLNRVRRTALDDGSYVLPVMFLLAIVIIGLIQFKMRSASLLIENSGNSVPEWANGYFVLLFFLTQGLALLQGFKYGFLGKDSERAYRLIGNRDSYDSYRVEFDDRVRRADESLSSLLSGLDRRYPNIVPDQALYLERVQRLKMAREATANDTDGDNNKPSNISQLPTPQNGTAA